MSKHLRKLVAAFNESARTIENNLAQWEEIHRQFLDRWPQDRLGELLTLKTYVIGRGDPDTFCYWIERKTRMLGSILGATAKKFKVYYNHEGGQYEWVAGFSDAKKAFRKTKAEIIGFLAAARDDRLDLIKDNQFFRTSHLVRGKLLYLYYPEKFLNVFAEDDIDYFLDKLGIAFDPAEHVIDKQDRLLDYKRRTSLLKEWSTLKFGYFLYDQFNPPSMSHALKQKTITDSQKGIISEEGDFVLPDIKQVNLTEITFEAINPSKPSKKKKKRPRKPNYLAENMRNAKLGSRAEEIVVLYEKKKLRKSKRHDLAKKVDRVSLKDDSLGYDIRSYNSRGKELLIEVKATKGSVEGNTPFFLTENERKCMDKNRSRYLIYRVFSANTEVPRLLVLNHRDVSEHCQLQTKLWQISFIQ